jgi:hypothetical protein
VSKRTQIGLLCFGLLCFVPFFYPTFRHENIPNGFKDSFFLGLPSSPWLTDINTETKFETQPTNAKAGPSISSMNLHQEFAIQWIAWSWLFPICGAVAIAVSRRKSRTSANG